ncbi:hypothetical protein [Acidaminococcus fermentans]|uniref:hypothetical protein n=1 Tax=Acidaminococcus fermentans TaxID=905 RepID=UPI002431777B|nr:hypothetical protein [Acidaminococcus fermentans]MCI6287094.1 hypothetical protein [Acidaminococcus fermentans]
MEQETKWRIILAIAGACVLCIIGGLIYGCGREKKEEPKVLDYQQTTDPATIQKKLDVSQGTAREITREIYRVQQSDSPPAITYYVQAPDLDTGAQQVAKDIQDGKPDMPAAAVEKTDRTIVTPNTDRQKVDIYKINLAKAHKIKVGAMSAGGKGYVGAGYQAGRWTGMIYTRSGRKVEAGSISYTVAEW